MFLKRSVTVNGIPFSMILDKTDSEQELAAISIRNMNDSAEENGISEMTTDDIDQEIAKYRKERKRSKK